MAHLLFLLSISVMAFSVLSLVSVFMLTRNSRGAAQRVLKISLDQSDDRGSGRSSLTDVQLKVFRAVRWLRSQLRMRDDPKLLERFAGAGCKSTASQDIYFAARMLGPVAAGLIGFSLFSSNRFFWIMVLAGLSYLGPDMILSRLVKRHRGKIRLSLPDAIDLLVICIDAGLGMDQAMLRVGQELGGSHPELNEELMRINREQRAGKPRLEAWKAMAQRIKLQELDGFVNMLMQNERFGTPIARALAIFGDGIRQKRRQRAEELAAKTTVKIIFPLVFCIFPCLFIVLLGPAAITIMRGFSSGQ